MNHKHLWILLNIYMTGYQPKSAETKDVDWLRDQGYIILTQNHTGIRWYPTPRGNVILTDVFVEARMKHDKRSAKRAKKT